MNFIIQTSECNSINQLIYDIIEVNYNIKLYVADNELIRKKQLQEKN